MIRRPPRSTRVRSSAASDVYKRQPRLGADDRRRDTPVVEQRGVGGEAFLPYQLLAVQASVRAAKLRVPLDWDVTHTAVVGQRRLPSVSRPNARPNARRALARQAWAASCGDSGRSGVTVPPRLAEQ